MIEDPQEPLEVIAEFLSPFEDTLNIVVLGDGVTDETVQDLEAAFNDIREAINTIPSMSGSHLGVANMFRYTTKELYRGAATEQLKEYSTIYTDPELSRQLIDLLNQDDNEVDELEAMLLDKYILQQPQEKYILDITSTSDEAINKIMVKMDSRPTEFNYILYGYHMAIWIYWLDEFTLIQGT
jgi:hypothetical protein